MSEDTVSETANDLVLPDRLTVLKQRAKLMGIPHSPNIGVEALQSKIDAKMAETDGGTTADDVANPLAGETQAPTKAAARKSFRQELMDEQLKLVRLRITNLDPKKKDLPGEILTVANEYIGTVRKYVPFGEVTDDGFHVPFILYTMMKDRKFLNVRVSKGSNGQQVIRQSWAQEFALEILPQLQDKELKQLAAAQSAAGLFGSDEQF